MKISQDIELGSGLSRVCQRGGGAEFSLLLAMLAQDLLSRPRFERPAIAASNEEAGSLARAPKVPTYASQEDWEHEKQAAAYAHQHDFVSLHLWQCMHPLPLSQFDDIKRIPDEVLANCGWHAKQRLQQAAQPVLHPQATSLFEVLEALPTQAA